MAKLTPSRLDGVYGMRTFTAEDLHDTASSFVHQISDPKNTDDLKVAVALGKESAMASTKKGQGARAQGPATQDQVTMRWKVVKIPVKRITHWSYLGGVLVFAMYFILLVGNPHDLEGKVSSYGFFAHDKRDVLEFENGMVTLKTCCGNEFYGDYTLRPDGTWIWYHQSFIRKNPPQLEFKEPRKIKVEPHLFSVTLRSEDGNTLKLPRRVFKRIPL